MPLGSLSRSREAAAGSGQLPDPERFQGFLKALADVVRDPELMLSAFRHGGMVERNLYVGDDVFPVIYLALWTGREPGAVVRMRLGLRRLRRGGLEELARRAHRRMHGADTEPQTTADRARRNA